MHEPYCGQIPLWQDLLWSTLVTFCNTLKFYPANRVPMNKTLNTLLVTFGVIFIILILVGIGFFLATSMGSKSSVVNTQTNTGTTETTKTADSNTTATPEADGSIAITLSDEQRSALSTFGIDPNTIPASISAEQVACFEAELGVARVAEIRAGDSPSAMDFFKAKSCI